MSTEHIKAARELNLQRPQVMRNNRSNGTSRRTSLEDVLELGEVLRAAEPKLRLRNDPEPRGKLLADRLVVRGERRSGINLF